MNKTYMIFATAVFTMLLNQIDAQSSWVDITQAGIPMTAGFSGDGGRGTAAELNSPMGLACDYPKDGDTIHIYIADVNNNRIRETKGLQFDSIYTFAGNGIAGSSGDGGPAALAELNGPDGLVTGDSGNMYVTEYYGNYVRKINTSGIITTIAGNGVQGYSGDGGAATAAELSQPVAVTVDHFGNVYISDNGNQRIRKVTPGGIISTFAGNGIAGFSGDGGLASTAEISSPEGIDVSDSIYVVFADKSNQRIREINSNGVINTIAGNGINGYSGDGGLPLSAELNNPMGVTYGGKKNSSILIADAGNSVIRVTSYYPSGNIYTIAGTGIATYDFNGIDALSCSLNNPTVILSDSGSFGLSDIVFSDNSNQLVRFLTLYTGNTTVKSFEKVSVFPNPSSGIFTIAGLQNVVSEIEVFNVLGEKVCEELRQPTDDKVIYLSDQPNGVYYYRVESESGRVLGSGKIVVLR